MKILALIFMLWSTFCMAQDCRTTYRYNMKDSVQYCTREFYNNGSSVMQRIDVSPQEGSIMIWAWAKDTSKPTTLVFGSPIYGHVEYEFSDGTVLTYRREQYSYYCRLSAGKETCYWKKNDTPISDADVYRQFINTDLVSIRRVEQQDISETTARPVWWKRTRWHYRIKRDINECLRKQGITDYSVQMWYWDIVVDVKGPYGRYAFSNLHTYFVSSEVKPDAATTQWLRERIKELSGAHI
ncbi:MAG TPA: hypothetical protein VK167_11835 [Flavipsychrobacter sp.]|nr:hypothetical protein [Flavipsychrobacter sp.]